MTELDRQQVIWEYFQTEVPEAFLGSIPRLNFLLKQISAGEVVLNVGVGSGLFEAMALKKGIDIYALDPGEKSILALQEKLRLGDKAKVGVGEEMPFEDAKFDVMVVSEVFEHLSDDAIFKFLQEAARVLKPDGRLIGTVPARENLSTQTVVCPCCSKTFHRWGHQQSFTVERLKGMFAPYCKSVDAWEEVFIPWTILNWKGRVTGFFKKTMAKFGSPGSDANVVFVCRFGTKKA